MIDIDSLIARDEIEQPHQLEQDFSDSLYIHADEYRGFQILLRQTMQHPILSRKQEQEYFETIQNGAGDDMKIEARNQIILHNQKLVLNIAMRYRGRGVTFKRGSATALSTGINQEERKPTKVAIAGNKVVMFPRRE